MGGWGYLRSMWYTYLSDASNHVKLQLQQPFLHLSSSLGRRYGVLQRNNFSLGAFHTHDIEDISEFQTGYSFEAFLQVGLYPKEKKDKVHQLTEFNSLTMVEAVRHTYSNCSCFHVSVMQSEFFH